jgi:alpha-amylase
MIICEYRFHSEQGRGADLKWRMFADVDYSNPEVRADVFRWGEWIGKELKLSGIRFDAIKHYSEDFLRDFIRHLDRTVGKNWFLVGEYWRDDLDVLAGYIERMGNRLSLFDVGLVGNLARISSARKPDLRTVFKGTLALHHPTNAVTFVQNHDTVGSNLFLILVQC